MLNTFTNQVKERLKRKSPTLLRWMGVRLLNKVETEALMWPAQISYVTKPPIHLPAVADISDPDKLLFEAKTVQTDPDFVWDFANPKHRASLLRCGIMKVGGKVLDTDFGNQALLADFLRSDHRPAEHHPVVMAPWSHYWGGYFDYLLFVAAKLGRLKRTLQPSLYDEAVVSYPLLHTSFETELLELLGIQPERIRDSRKHALSFDRCLLANNSSWFYPSVADILGLKEIIESQLPPDPSAPRRRIYISRAGRRRVTNEEELMPMLQQYGFEFIEDKPRPIAEQVRLYQSADLIIGPHGASFANILWCSSGTQLFELFPANYHPEFFRYLAQVLGLSYAAYCHGSLQESHHANVDSDLTVSVEEVEQSLVKLLKTSH